MNFAKLWPLAVSDILFKFNGDALCTLGCLGTADQIRDQMLKKWWGIGSRDELFKTLDWLSNEGHSKFHRALNAGQFSAEEYKYGRASDHRKHESCTEFCICHPFQQRTPHFQWQTSTHTAKPITRNQSSN